MEAFLADYLWEAGRVEAIFCRWAYQLAGEPLNEANLEQWRALNQQLSARKPARERRSASVTLGRRFLQLTASLEPAPWLATTATLSANPGSTVHHSLAFGLVGGALVLGGIRQTTCWRQSQSRLAPAIAACLYL
jgi:urease accessory protein UreF